MSSRGSPARRSCTGALAPSVTLFYFFDFSAVNVHSLLGWCGARLPCSPGASPPWHLLPSPRQLLPPQRLCPRSDSPRHARLRLLLPAHRRPRRSPELAA